MARDPRQFRLHRQTPEGWLAMHSPWKHRLPVPGASLPSFPTPEEERVLVSGEAAVVAAIQAPQGFTTEGVRDHQERDETSPRCAKCGKPSRLPRQRSNCCLPDQRRLLAFLPSLHQDPSSRSLESSDSRRRNIEQASLRPPRSTPSGRRSRSSVLRTCRHHCHCRLLPEEGLHVPSGPGSPLRPPTMSRVPSEESAEAQTRRTSFALACKPGAPFQDWSMDVLGPLRASSKGNRYLLSLKDVFSKWFEAIPLGNTTSEKVLWALKTLYARFGYPLQDPYRQCHLLSVSGDAGGFPTVRCPTHFHTDLQSSV